MKPIVFVFLAVILYAFQNVLLEQKLSKFTASGLLVYFYLCMLPLAFFAVGYLKITGQEISLPRGHFIALTLVGGIIYFLADFFYLSAYTSGGSVFTVTTIMMLFPLMASVVKFFWVGGVPNPCQIFGYIFGVLAVIFVVKGSVFETLK